MQLRVLTILIFAVFVLQGCGVVKRGTIPWEEKPQEPASEPVSTASPTAISASKGDRFTGEKEIKSILDRAYKDWKGVPYVLGGSGFDGVDCSAFMQIVFEDYFSKQLPRNTREQFGVGAKLKQSEVRTGDLVFFKTGAKLFHVGVMVNEVEFMHASTSSGVMISSLQNNYWQQVYYTARRVL